MKRLIVEQYINDVWTVVFVGREENTMAEGFSEATEISRVLHMMRGECGVLLSGDGKGTLVTKLHGPIRAFYADSGSTCIGTSSLLKKSAPEGTIIGGGGLASMSKPVENTKIITETSDQNVEPYTTAPSSGFSESQDVPFVEGLVGDNSMKIDRRKKEFRHLP